MTPDVTVCTVAYNAAAAVELMWRSFVRRHGPGAAFLHAHDNGSTDGAAEYLRAHAARFSGGVDRQHGPALTDLCLAVETPYTLVCDTDVEYLEPVLDRLKAELAAPGAGGVCHPSAAGMPDLGPCLFYGRPMRSLRRVDPCCEFFRTADLQRFLRASAGGVGWSMRVDEPAGELYDSGAEVRRVLEAEGLALAEPAWLGAAVRHYGGLTCLFVMDEMAARDRGAALHVDPSLDGVQFTRRRRYEAVRARLAEYRAGL